MTFTVNPTTWQNDTYVCDRCGATAPANKGGLPSGWAQWQPRCPPHFTKKRRHDWLIFKAYQHFCEKCPPVGD